MLTITGFLNKYWQFIIIVLMGLYIVWQGNKKGPIDKNADKIDSILRTLTIPERTGTFTQTSPQPIIITVPQQGSTDPGLSNELLRAFADMKDDNARTRAYAEAVALKVYENKYSDSTVAITVKDSVEGGVLKHQSVDWTVKKMEAQYYENVYYMKPKYTISGGMQFQTAVDSTGLSHAQIFPKIGFKGRNGWKFEGGVNLLNTKEFMFGVEKDIFTKYNKIEEKKQF